MNKAIVLFVASLSTQSIALAETNMQSFETASLAYSDLRSEASSKVQAIDEESSALAAEVESKLEVLERKLQECPDFDCAKRVDQEKRELKEEWENKSETNVLEIQNIQKQVKSAALTLAAGTFAWEVSRVLLEDARFGGLHIQPFHDCTQPYASIEHGRCLEAVVNFKSGQKFYEMLIKVGLGEHWFKRIPPPGAGERAMTPNDVLASLDELFSKSKDVLLEEFTRSLDELAQGGQLSEHVYTYEAYGWSCGEMGSSCSRFYFNSLTSLGFRSDLNHVIP